MPTFNVHTENETFSIDAEYYQHDNGWITFKDTSNKVVLDLREDLVHRIQREQSEKTPQITVKNAYISGQALPAIAERLNRLSGGPL